MPRPSSAATEPIQLYRPVSSCRDAKALLRKEDFLTEQDVADILAGKTTTATVCDKEESPF